MCGFGVCLFWFCLCFFVLVLFVCVWFWVVFFSPPCLGLSVSEAFFFIFLPPAVMEVVLHFITSLRNLTASIVKARGLDREHLIHPFVSGACFFIPLSQRLVFLSLLQQSRAESMCRE